MKIQTGNDKKHTQANAASARSRLRKQAELRGVPEFALRLLAARRLPFAQTEAALRYRHD
jgi:hypothetical protein